VRIVSVESKAYRLKLNEPWMSAKYRITHHELVRTRVTVDDGSHGDGWCTTIGVAGLSVASLVNSYLVPLIDGEDARNNERLWERLWQDLHFAGAGGISTLAIATIDIALWDLRAKSARMPLWQLLGGMHDSVAVYASAVNLHLTLDELQAQVERQLGDGYETFKLKIGRADFEDDLNRVRAIRAQIGPSRTLLLDANQRWTAGEAVIRCRALAEVRPGWIEEPLLSDDVAGHAHVRATGALPVAVGEQLGNRFDFWNYVRADAADYLQPNVWKVGGITEWLKIAHLAQHANLPVAPHSALELSAHLLAAVPNGWMVENIFGGNLADFGIVDEAPEVEGARVRLGARPGHGVVFNETALARFVMTEGVVQREQTTHAGL
jgi:L-alanine-DL-glutamate epimerase-like enolase superfamily enzyme